MKDLSQGARMTFFVIYTILWEIFIWGGAGYLVYFMDASAWLLILAVIMSSAQFQPRSFGIDTRRKNPEDMDEDEYEQYEKALKLEIELEKLKEKNNDK